MLRRIRTPVILVKNLEAIDRSFQCHQRAPPLSIFADRQVTEGLSKLFEMQFIALTFWKPCNCVTTGQMTYLEKSASPSPVTTSSRREMLFARMDKDCQTIAPCVNRRMRIFVMFFNAPMGLASEAMRKECHSLQTDSSLTEILVNGLDSWLHGTPFDTTDFAEDYAAVDREKLQIGWKQLLQDVFPNLGDCCSSAAMMVASQ
jgi:hypothetical protein